eukprot:256868_1
MMLQTQDRKAFPSKIKVVEDIRGRQQAGPSYDQPTIIIPNIEANGISKRKSIDVNESLVTNIDTIDEICVVGSDDKSKQAEQENVIVAHVEQISKHPEWGDNINDDQDAAIINCIGRVYFRLNENDNELRSGTGTVIKKFGNDFIAILTCAHVVVKDDGNEVDRIWFSSNSEDRNDNDR